MSQLHCPHCGGRQLQVATSTQFSTFTNITSKQVTTTVLSENTRYWCCADCGNTFPFPQDVQQQANALEQSSKFYQKFANLGWIVGGVLFVLGIASDDMAIFSIAGAPAILLWLAAALCTFWLSPSQLKDAEKLRVEYEDLLSKCMD